MAKLLITAKMIMSELERRGIAVTGETPESVSMLSFVYGGKQRLLMGCTPDFASAISVPICRSKLMTEWIIKRDTSIPLPSTSLHESDESSAAFLAAHQRIVVKPQDGAHGQGVSVNVTLEERMHSAIASAKEQSKTGTVLLQEMITGEDLRVLVIDGKAIAAVYRRPPHVIGDGATTVRELIRIENESNSDRGEVGYTKRLNKIYTDAAIRYLGNTIESVPAKGESVQVVGTANIGTGGEAEECFNGLPQALIQHAIDAASAARAFICGVDFIYDSATGKYALIELNSSPSFGLHAHPSIGNAVDVVVPYVDALIAKYDREATA